MIRQGLAGLVALLATAGVSAADRLAPHPDPEAARALMGLNRLSALDHHGTAAEIHYTDGYVYIRAESDGRHTWLAAPRQHVPAGAAVRWGAGVEMSDFRSKQLDRFFHTIVFVDRIAVGPLR